MDSIIPLGQKNTLAEYMILSGADSCPPMLDKYLYDSLKSRMELYMQNRENGRMILESVENGPLIWHTIEENRVTRTKKYVELSATEKIKVAKDLMEQSSTTHGKLHAYLEQHELHANEVRIMRERNQDPLALVVNHQMTPSHFNNYQYSYNNHQFQQQLSPSQSHPYGSIPPIQHYSTTYQSTPLVISYPSTSYPNAYSSTFHQEGLSTTTILVPVFKQGDDPIDAITKMMSFLSTVVTIQPLQGRQNSYAAGTSGTRANTSGTEGNYSSQQRVIECFNYQGEGHMARQCPKPKRKRDATWFRDKVLLVEAQGNGKFLNEEELEFLADLGVVEGPVTQSIITHNAAYQADYLDTYDSDCDEIFTAKVVLMANLSSYGSDVLSEVPYSDKLLK
ncbi:retrovirus-related pol polyprotein from transposon TNT 1-94 [Tanacetum coccineum]